MCVFVWKGSVKDVNVAHCPLLLFTATANTKHYKDKLNYDGDDDDTTATFTNAENFFFNTKAMQVVVKMYVCVWIVSYYSSSTLNKKDCKVSKKIS